MGDGPSVRHRALYVRGSHYRLEASGKSVITTAAALEPSVLSCSRQCGVLGRYGSARWPLYTSFSYT